MRISFLKRIRPFSGDCSPGFTSVTRLSTRCNHLIRLHLFILCVVSCCLVARVSVRFMFSFCNLVLFDPSFEELLEEENFPALTIKQGCFTHASVVPATEVIQLIREDRISKRQPNFQRTKKRESDELKTIRAISR